MKKKVIIGIIVAGVLAIGAATVAIIISKNQKAEEPKDIATITMPAIAGTPYVWSYTIKNPNIVELVDEQTTIEENSELLGAPVNKVYTFKGINPGETEIIYDYTSVTDGYISERITYKIIVDDAHVTTLETLSHDYDINPNAENSTSQTEDIEPGIAE